MHKNLENIKRVFIDSNVLIYWLEEHRGYFISLKDFFSHCYQSNIQICASELIIGESLFGVYKYNLDMEDIYHRYFSQEGNIQLFPIEQEYLYVAAKLGAQNTNLFDAIHLITALQNGGDIFLTNDKKIKSDTIKILQLSDI